MTARWALHAPGPMRAVKACGADWLDGSGRGTGRCSGPPLATANGTAP
jgi:hypothetical protein